MWIPSGMRRALVVVVRACILRWWHGSGVRAEGRVTLFGVVSGCGSAGVSELGRWDKGDLG